jgi:ATP-dependent NAD(P)H-hydrate dehydratase
MRTFDSLLGYFCKNVACMYSQSQTKGSGGRIIVIGGSEVYTGAPFFAAMAAMRTGADMVHVFCPVAAAPIIKSYSPDLMVHPTSFITGCSTSLLSQERLTEFLRPWISGPKPSDPTSQPHALVVGPGLGRSLDTQICTKIVISLAQEYNIPCIIDADSLSVFEADNISIWNGSIPKSLVVPFSPLILTPNHRELSRIARGYSKDHKDLGSDTLESRNENLLTLARMLPTVHVLSKGSIDILGMGNGDTMIIKDRDDISLKRCGGQGDMLDGILATFIAWGKQKALQSADNETILKSCIIGASSYMRYLSWHTWKEYKSSMVTSDIISKTMPIYPISEFMCQAECQLEVPSVNSS